MTEHQNLNGAVEPRYTLDEAEEVFAARECDLHGHDFEFLVSGAGDLTGMLCGRCGQRWRTEKV